MCMKILWNNLLSSASKKIVIHFYLLKCSRYSLSSDSRPQKSHVTVGCYLFSGESRYKDDRKLTAPAYVLRVVMCCDSRPPLRPKYILLFARLYEVQSCVVAVRRAGDLPHSESHITYLMKAHRQESLHCWKLISVLPIYPQWKQSV